MRSFLLIAVLLLIVRTGRAQELLEQQRWPDGTLKHTTYSDGTRLFFISYHENGRVKDMGSYRNGKLDGVWKQYSDTGALLAQASFNNGRRQGVWQFRTTGDQLLGTLRYEDGILTSGALYGETGELVAQRDYP